MFENVFSALFRQRGSRAMNSLMIMASRKFTTNCCGTFAVVWAAKITRSPFRTFPST